MKIFEKNTKKLYTLRQFSLSLSLPLSPSPSLSLSLPLSLSPSLSILPQHTHTISRTAEKDQFCAMIWRMRWCWMMWFSKGECPVPAQHKKSGNTENGSIRRWAKLVGWLMDCQEFSQVVRSSWFEARIITVELEESLYCIHESMGNQWREARWGEMWSVLETFKTTFFLKCFHLYFPMIKDHILGLLLLGCFRISKVGFHLIRKQHFLSLTNDCRVQWYPLNNSVQLLGWSHGTN